MASTPERNGTVASGTMRRNRVAVAPTQSAPSGDRRQRSAPLRRAAVVKRIRDLAALCEPANETAGLDELARLIARAAGRSRGRSAVARAVSDCLENAADCGTDRTRWACDEAAAWATAWLSQRRPEDDHLQSIVARLCDEGEAATHRLAAGDTAPARFAIVLGRLFSDVDACRTHEAVAVAALSNSLATLVAPSGAVALDGSAAIIAQLADWCRCREVALATGALPWDAAGEQRWHEAVTVGVRLLGGRGRILEGSGRLPAAAAQPLLAAIEHDAPTVAGFPKRLRRAVRLLRGRNPSPAGRLPATDFHDADAGLTIMRSGWEAGAPGLRVMLDHRGATPWLEIAVNDRLLVAGPWRAEITVAGRRREPQGPWSVEAWEPGRKVSFIEISTALGDGIRLDRHLVVLHRQGIVLAGDAVVARAAQPEVVGQAAPATAEHDDDIDYAGTIPLASGLDAEAATETREILLSEGEARCRGMALPLALPEWRSGGGGSFTATPAGLVLRQGAPGRLYAPVWIDCDAARAAGPLTWRQLTVADSRRILAAWQAVGFRVQAGAEQWLVYRALDTPRNRTVLGCNLACEFLVGRIKPRGLIARILEIV